ncbi:D-sedoheptulose-7-phosphate isomerase [Bacteroides cellulosilyticus]|uniref:D-sedoheptulose-7-phosphate isomerase n=1 Tax=Bacteroides cellulosilyticus TaxID=246787 RepID=UPI0032BFF606
MNRKEILTAHFTEYRKKVEDLYDSVNIDEVEKVLTTIIGTFKRGNTLFICGNGGSAATASHMQVDFTYFIRHFTDYKPRILSLTDHCPMLTAIGNDRSFEDIFKDQLRGMMREGDTVIFISASGNSENLVRGANYVNENGGISIGWVGFDGGKLEHICSMCLHNENPKGDYGPIEDLHMFYVHLLVNYIGKDEEFLSLK